MLRFPDFFGVVAFQRNDSKSYVVYTITANFLQHARIITLIYAVNSLNSNITEKSGVNAVNANTVSIPT